MSYDLVFARAARKSLQKLPKEVQSRVLEAAKSLRNDPRPQGSRKLRGSDRLWRIRVGDYRIIYSIDDDQRIVDVNTVRHRSDAYR